MSFKKILIVNTTFNKGGAAEIARNLFESSKSNFEIFFAYGRGLASKNKKTFKFGYKIEFFIHVALVRFFGLEGFGSYFSTKKLIKFIKREKFDLIHLHNLHGYYLNFFYLVNFLKKQKIPVIWTFHDEWPITWLPAHSLECNHCKNLVGKCTNTYSYPKNYFPLFDKFMLNKKKEVFANGWKPIIVCPSSWLAEKIQKSFLNKFEIKVINNGIDVEVFKPVTNKDQLKNKYGLPLNKKIIIFSASNLNDGSKGIKYILGAAKALKHRNFLFVGVGRGRITETTSVKILGYFYNKKELAQIYALSDIFCFASVAETFLLSAAEALASGLPVVGFDLPVVRELVRDDVGILIKNRNINSLAEAIDGLARDKNKMAGMSQLGRNLIETNYSNETFFRNYFGLYACKS